LLAHPVELKPHGLCLAWATLAAAPLGQVVSTGMTGMTLLDLLAQLTPAEEVGPLRSGHPPGPCVGATGLGYPPAACGTAGGESGEEGGEEFAWPA
jgi:hypothetical protein